jgi:ArsR family transcriptional regulator, virulence genes transcriptional regulator
MKYPLPKIAYSRNAHIYKFLANPKRLEILNLLREQEMSVEELIKTVGVSKANISQHLAILRHAGLVKARREGLNVYYRIVDPLVVEPCRILYRLWGNKKVSFTVHS